MFKFHRRIEQRTVVTQRAVGSDVDVLLLGVFDQIVLGQVWVRFDLVGNLTNCQQAQGSGLLHLLREQHQLHR